MLVHIPRSFMSGDDPFIPVSLAQFDGRAVGGELVFEARHEGFIGIPHGGLAMGLCLDAWRRIGAPGYPVEAKFKFGGSGVAIGDLVDFQVERSNPGESPMVTAKLTRRGDKTPYVRADIVPAGPGNGPDGPPGRPPEEFRGLPYYKNCFVCGHHRSVPGLQRRFRAHTGKSGPVTTVVWGGSPDDRDRAELFLIGEDELHPAILMSIFDENAGWSGFMLTRACGLSVRASFTLLRPVKKSEPLLFMGWPVGVRGNPKAPRFFLAGGAALSTKDPGRPETVAFGQGEWIIRDEYTRQITENLLPEDDWQWIFGNREG
ncbi:MAG: hypothetical protein FJ118_18180 [Deltaproteobacteria bacterium]|nr:hypothetical protein [Deltaproteobacteria bacterium]